MLSLFSFFLCHALLIISNRLNVLSVFVHFDCNNYETKLVETTKKHTKHHSLQQQQKMPFVTPDPRFPGRQGYPASDDTRNGLGPELETSPIVIVQDENARPFRYSFQTDYFCSAKGLARLVVSVSL